LLGRDGRVISCHLPEASGALIAQAPAMVDAMQHQFTLEEKK
jgi:hypothetical protein